MLNITKRLQYLILIFTLIMVGGCNPYRKLNILQEGKEAKDSINYSQTQQLHIIQPGDVLNIKVYENSVDISKTFNTTFETNLGNLNSNAAVYLSGFPVNSNGTINHPAIGEFTVAGKTIFEIRSGLQNKFNEIMSGVSINVTLINHRYTVLGEVNNPGIFNAYNEQINILEAIGQAGGFSEFANSTRIKIIRKSSNGKSSTMHTLNLSEDKFLFSNKFYIMPNDVIYVEPLKSKSFNLTYKQISPLITSVTAVISIINLSVLIYQNAKK